MTNQPRRKFIKSFLIAACSGIGVYFPLSSCRKSNSELNSEKKQEKAMANNNDFVFEPAYLKLHKSGELKKRGEKLWSSMTECNLCPRECGTNRLKGKRGFCCASAQLEISSFNPHFGEERPLVGRHGSGTIFFSNCSLRCVFCINWQISHGGEGTERTIEQLAQMMLKLQNIKCANINVVTPTHYLPHIILAIDKAASKGLRLPIVYNTCGWEKIDMLKVLDGIADIYLPDFKYANRNMAEKYSSNAAAYPEITKNALLEMHRQVGTAVVQKDGLVYRGLMIRHLVMPNNVGGTKDVVQWIANNLPKDTYVNIMSQYRPMYKANNYPEISRPITRAEYRDAVKWAKEAGLTNLDLQGF